MKRLFSTALCLLPLAGCASVIPGAAGAADRPLAYHASGGPGDTLYDFSDSTAMALQAGPMGTMRIVSAQAGLLRLTISDGDDGSLRALVEVLSFHGSFENPAQGELTADESDISGAWTVALDPTGRMEVVDTATLTERGRAVLGGESFIRPFFVGLPGHTVEPGATWTDTVLTTDRNAEAVTRARSIVTSTLDGDTVVDGRSLAVIRTTAGTTLEVEGSSGGVAVLQRMSGSTRGTVLWDVAAGVLVEREESGEMEGVLELPGRGFDAIPVEATLSRRIRLRP